MTRIPRNISGELLAKRLARLGYEKVRQRGSHRTLRTEQGGRHSLHVPMHNPIKVGMLEDLLKDLAEYHKLSVDELLSMLGLD